MRILNIEIKECKKCPFRQVGTYKYIDSNDTVDYCLLAPKEQYTGHMQEMEFQKCAHYPIKIKEDN